MKLEISKEQCLRLAKLEEGHTVGAGLLAVDPVPTGNPEAVWKLVMAMKLNGLPKEALNQGFLADFEIKKFEEYWARSYVELCKGSTLHD